MEGILKFLSINRLLILLSLTFLLVDAGTVGAINLPASTVQELSRQSTIKVPPAEKGRAIRGCPRLVATELHIVRVVPQRTTTGEQAYRYVLNGTIQNRGFVGVAVAGLNVSQQTERGAPKRIALKLFNQRVQLNQRLDLLGDLHVQVESEPVLATAPALPSFSLNVLNLQNDYSQCGEREETTVSISSDVVRRALPAQINGGVSQKVGTLGNTNKKINWNQPSAASAAKPKSTNVNVGTNPVALPQSSAAANNARRIGEDAARTKQIQQIQKMRELGSPMDQARRGPAGPTGGQDCQHSSDPAGCLQSNLHSPSQTRTPGSNRDSIQECLQSRGNPADCMGDGNREGTGHLSTGPAGDPRGRLKDPRSLSSTQFSEPSSEQPGKRVEWGAYQETESQDGITGKYRQGVDASGNVHMESFLYNHETGSRIHTTSVWDKETDAATFHTVERDASGHVVADHTDRVHPQNEQGAPDGSNSLANDNCDWNPALGKCMKSRPDPKGMTSQPGPDGENPGSDPGSATPHIGSEAVTNGGGGDWNTSDRRGFGLGNSNKPLDMKDPGSIPGGTKPK